MLMFTELCELSEDLALAPLNQKIGLILIKTMIITT